MLNRHQAIIKERLMLYGKTNSTCAKKQNSALLIVGSQEFVGTNHRNDHKKCSNHCYRTENSIPSGTSYEKCYSLHAEIDVILKAQRTCSILNNAEIWVTSLPCANCAKVIIAVGIKKVNYFEDREDEFTKELFKQNSVKITYLSEDQ